MTSPIITEAVRVLIDRRDLTRIEAAAAMDAIMSGAATNAQIAAFLTALRMKGETVEELIGFAQVMRQKAVKVRAHASDVVAATGTDREMLIDTCGTGGDASGTFNVSTATAFVELIAETSYRSLDELLSPLVQLAPLSSLYRTVPLAPTAYTALPLTDSPYSVWLDDESTSAHPAARTVDGMPANVARRTNRTKAEKDRECIRR